MKKSNDILKRGFSVLLFLVFFGYQGVSQELEEIRSMGDTVISSMTYIDANTLLALAATSNDSVAVVAFVQKMNNCGEVLASVKIWNEEFLSDTIIPYFSEIYRFREHDPCFFFLKKRIGSDTCTFHKAIIHDDMSLSFEDYYWYGSNLTEGFAGGYLAEKTVESIINRDGSVVLSYNTNNDSIALVRFDESGNVLAERLFETHSDVLSGHGLISTPDSLGFRIIRRRTDGQYGYSCFTFDAELNIVDTIVNVDQYSYPPVSCSEMAYFRANPYSGKTYSINKWSVPAYNGNPEIYQDILMSVYDENMVQTHYTWGIHTSTVCQGGSKYTIDFGSSDEIYMAGGMDGIVPHNLYVAYLDKDLNKYGEVYFIHPSKYLIASSLVACPDGGCLVYCDGLNDNTYAAENCIYKITISDFMNIDEAHSNGFAVAAVYPNPGGNILNIRTVLQDARVEVCDMNGRLVHTQDITENVTTINAEDWAMGMYVWKVFSYGKEAECGKWIKK